MPEQPQSRRTTKDYLIRLYPEDEGNLAAVVQDLAETLGPRVTATEAFRYLLREHRRNSVNGKEKKLPKKKRIST